MLRRRAYLAALSVCAFAPAAATLAAEFKPVTAEVLVNPDPPDWLMVNRTYDEQRFSPLKQINRSNVSELRMVWTRGMPPGTQESTPMVYNGVMYVIAPGGGVQALDGTSGDLVWEYWRTYPKDMAQTIRAAALSRGKNLAMFEDMVYFAASDGFLVALDAHTGKVRWETKAHDYTKGTEHTGGLMVADGKVISNKAQVAGLVGGQIQNGGVHQMAMILGDQLAPDLLRLMARQDLQRLLLQLLELLVDHGLVLSSIDRKLLRLSRCACRQPLSAARRPPS